MTEIVVVNRSTAFNDDAVRAMLGPAEKWLNTLVCPAYGLDPSFTLTFAAEAPEGAWLMEVLDHADQPGVLGYHLDSQGRVSGKVFVADCLADGVSASVDFTHELGEMAGDPTADVMMTLPGGIKTIREICDPVEGDQCGIDVDSVLCSDFVLPSYWGGTAPYDQRGLLTAPAPALTSGGYISLYENGQWTQKFAELAGGRLADRAARHVRRIGRHAWRRQNT